MEVIDGTFIVKNKCRLQSEFNLVGYFKELSLIETHS